MYAQLRVDCERIGHALGQRDHDADRWIAATALRLGVPLVSNDQIFRDVPGLVLESAASPDRRRGSVDVQRHGPRLRPHHFKRSRARQARVVPATYP